MQHLPAVILSLALSAAALPASAAEPQPVCAPTVSAALTLWDGSMAAAEKLGGRAVALAREKGRELILPLLGVDPKSVAEPGAADDVAREVEASRADPERRAALCAAITRAVEEAKDKAGAGLDALRRAVEGLRPAQPAQPEPAKGNLIKT